MHPFIEANLAALLFAPWFAILAVLYWIYPRKPRPSWRGPYDAAALGIAADRGYGRMWQQIVGTSVSYGAFLTVLTLASWFRHRLLRR
jgi:uncharacterized BrkB/YihY/UPF0761 family membrane protein